MIREIVGVSDMMTPYLTLRCDMVVICFQNKAKIILRQAFLAIKILCESDEASCNILSFTTSNIKR